MPTETSSPSGAGGSKPLGARASALCPSLPRLRSAQFERSSAIRRLLCRGPAQGQPGRDSILRSTRADALHSTSPRFGNTSASRCSGHGTWKNSKLGRLERALEHDAPRGSSFQHPTESYDLSVRRAVAHRRERTQLVDPQSGSGRVLLARALGSIKSEVAKLAFLRQLGAHEWDLSDLNPNRRKFLAQVGRRSTSQTLQGMPDRRRYPILVALLHETTLDLVDEIVDLFNRALQKTDSRSRRELEAWRVATAQASNEKVRLFSRLGRLVLDPDIPDEQLRRRIFEEVASRELFAASVEETEQLLRPRDGSYLDFVENRYGHLRKFAPLVLRVLGRTRA